MSESAAPGLDMFGSLDEGEEETEGNEVTTTTTDEPRIVFNKKTLVKLKEMLQERFLTES